jgi:hypothetical protein
VKASRFVFGLYDATGEECESSTRARLRDLSLSWARFGYQGPVIERPGVGLILDEALELGFEYCLLLASGTLFDENWYPAHWGRRDAHGSLKELVNDGDFLAAGRTAQEPSGSHVIDGRCLLVNLRRYLLSGRPKLAGARVAPIAQSGSLLEPDGGPALWSLRDAAGGRSAIFRAFDPTTAAAIVDLVSLQGDAAPAAPFLARGIQRFPQGQGATTPAKSTAQGRLLAKVRSQVEGAKRNVFPWNLEAYDDVDVPPAELTGALSAVYCVAAGFKPYRILKTHGFEATTRVVLFDYSSRALEFRQRLIDEWDGADYPGFVRKTFREMPPDTYFQLWAGLTPDSVAAADLDQVWKAETDRWGNEKTFQKHWNLCRSLPHEFILCDLLEHPEVLLEHIRPVPNAVVWWSNAFFTIYSNWFFTIADRRERYLRFVSGLAVSAPALFLYGADHLNSSVNSIRADEYAARLAAAWNDAGHELMPARFHRLQIRS